MKSHERRVMIHFYNAPIYNTEKVEEYLANVGFRRRMDHPPYSPALTSCDFFFVGIIKENFS
jgi:hypothetical protein